MKVLVFIEHRDGQIKKASFEAVRTAAGIANELGATVTAVSFGAVDSLASTGSYGAVKAITVHNPRMTSYSVTACAKAVHAVAEKEGADMVFLSATAMGKDLAPRLAVRMDGACVPDITGLEVDGNAILATRPIFAGKALETVKVVCPKQVYTLRPNVFSAGTPDGSDCPVEEFDAGLEDGDFASVVEGVSISTEKLDVSEAAVIVSGGRGMQGPEHWGLIENLAKTLGAATGASRAVVDAGWRPHEEQVGQTGKTVSPTLYIACGISGAVQHLAGMSSSKVIVAVNKDKDAPIFQIADYGIIGDVFEVLPRLTEELAKVTGK
jgi:electron transfer flavoprotein alpha subunit